MGHTPSSNAHRLLTSCSLWLNTSCRASITLWRMFSISVTRCRKKQEFFCLLQGNNMNDPHKIEELMHYRQTTACGLKDNCLTPEQHENVIHALAPFKEKWQQLKKLFFSFKLDFYLCGVSQIFCTRRQLFLNSWCLVLFTTHLCQAGF